jgi:hypothetical protein
MQWLEECKRRRETGPGSELRKREAALAKSAGNGPKHNAGKDRGGDEAERA